MATEKVFPLLQISIEGFSAHLTGDVSVWGERARAGFGCGAGPRSGVSPEVRAVMPLA